jgi:hypothetical protein
MDGVSESIYLGDPKVDRLSSHLVSSHYTMKIRTLSFSTFDLTCPFWYFVDPHNCMDPHSQIVSYLLTFFLWFSSQNHSFSQVCCRCHKRCGRVSMMNSLPSSSAVSPHWHSKVYPDLSLMLWDLLLLLGYLIAIINTTCIGTKYGHLSKKLFLVLSHSEIC